MIAEDARMRSIESQLSTLRTSAYQEQVILQDSEVVLSGWSGPFVMKKGDLKPSLTLFLKTSAGLALDLTTATDVVAYMALVSTPALVIDGAAVTVVDPDGGEIRYDWQTGDTDDEGEYLFEVKINWGAGSFQTLPAQTACRVQIKDSLPSHHVTP